MRCDLLDGWRHHGLLCRATPAARRDADATNYFLFAAVRISSNRSNGVAFPLWNENSLLHRQTKCATFGERAVARNITSAQEPGSIVSRYQHSTVLPMLANFRSVDRSVPAFAGTMIHNVATGVRLFRRETAN